MSEASLVSVALTSASIGAQYVVSCDGLRGPVQVEVAAEPGGVTSLQTLIGHEHDFVDLGCHLARFVTGYERGASQP